MGRRANEWLRARPRFGAIAPAVKHFRILSRTAATGSATISGNTAYGSTSGTSSGLAIAQRRYCVINVVMAGDAVSTVNYSGPTGGLLTGGEQCAYAVRGCIRK